jgi:hypothetical protein
MRNRFGASRRSTTDIALTVTPPESFRRAQESGHQAAHLLCTLGSVLSIPETAMSRVATFTWRTKLSSWWTDTTRLQIHSEDRTVLEQGGSAGGYVSERA